MAHIEIRGNLGRDAELNVLQSGTPVLGLTVAENHRKKTQSGEWVDDGTTWHDVSVWDKAAEALAEARLTKGTTVLVIGEMRLETKPGKDGVDRTYSKVRARHVAVIPQQPRQQSHAAASQPYSRPADQPDPWGATGAQTGAQEPPF